MPAAAPRIAFAFDQLYPESVGGAQRYYWALTRELATRTAVSYLTPKRWAGPRVVERDGVEIVGIGSPGGPARFGAALAAHLARHGNRYAALHCACFPAGVAAMALPAARARRLAFAVDWHEVLPRTSWRRIRGRGGDLRWRLQRVAVRGADLAVTFSALHERRLREEGRRGPVARLPEFLPSGDQGPPADEAPRERLLVCLGRLEHYKRAHLTAPVLAHLRDRQPGAHWRAIVIGDGPARARVEQAARAAGVAGSLELAGFMEWDDVGDTLARCAAMLLASEREGFGLAVLEAAAHGVPTVTVAAPDNAAVELIDPGVNGEVCATDDPATIAEAVLRVSHPEAPARARSWYEQAAHDFSVQAAADAHLRLHQSLQAA